jgi:hypothetical protein
MTALKTISAGAAAAFLIAGLPSSFSPAAAATPHHFRNCDALHHKFPHGVGLRHAHDHTRSGTDPVTNFARRPAWYRVNRDLDADHDHIACEEH